MLAGYLSKLKFTEADGLHVPDEKLPEGFLFNHMRCSRRTLYAPREGFTLIISEESTWCSDVRGEQNRETVRIDNLVPRPSLLFLPCRRGERRSSSTTREEKERGPGNEVVRID